MTGACLAVERRKFEAVGGFDLEHLPIELNDVDLCLRLGERGWKSVCLSQISLFHEESASRGGAKFRLLKVHAKEREYFIDRWSPLFATITSFTPLFLYSAGSKRLGELGRYCLAFRVALVGLRCLRKAAVTGFFLLVL